MDGREENIKLITKIINTILLYRFLHSHDLILHFLLIPFLPRRPSPTSSALVISPYPSVPLPIPSLSFLPFDGPLLLLILLTILLLLHLLLLLPSSPPPLSLYNNHPAITVPPPPPLHLIPLLHSDPHPHGRSHIFYFLRAQ